MDLPEDLKDIFKRKMIDRYTDCSNIISFGGKYLILDSFCYAEFLRFFYIVSNTKFTDNDCQPEEPSNELTEDIHNTDHIYPKKFPLMSYKEKLKFSIVPHVFQFCLANQQTQSEEYSH